MKFGSLNSAVYNSTTMSEMSLTEHFLCSNATRDNLYQSNCLKWPCVRTQASNLFSLINCFVYNNQPTCSSPSAAAVPRHVSACGRLASAWCITRQNAVINRFDVRTVGQPHVKSGEFGFLTTKQLHCLVCTMSQWTVVLKDVNFIGDASDG